MFLFYIKIVPKLKFIKKSLHILLLFFKYFFIEKLFEIKAIIKKKQDKSPNKE